MFGWFKKKETMSEEIVNKNEGEKMNTEIDYERFTFGCDEHAVAISEAFSKFDNKNFKKSFTRAVQNFNGHLNSLYMSNLNGHSKAFYLETLMPQIINTFNGIRENYRGRKNAYHMNVACGKAIQHFRFKVKKCRESIVSIPKM